MDNPKTPGSTSAPSIEKQNSQGQGSLVKGGSVYNDHANGGTATRASGVKKDSSKFG